MVSAVTNVEFLEAMFADLTDEAAALVCGFAGDPHTASRGVWYARPWGFGSRLGPGHTTNNYVAVSSFLPDPANGEYRRRKAQFARLHAVMLDDLGDGPGAKLPLGHAERLPVSALVETSPANFQAWIFLQPSADTDSRETAERLIARMIRDGLTANSDPGMAGVTRYGRLPVGVNGKAKYRRNGQPARVRLERWHPERRYTVAEVARAFNLDLTPEPARSRPTVTLSAAHRRIDSFASLLDVLAGAGHYIEPLGEGRHAIRCPWIDAHTDRAESGSALLEPGPNNNWFGGYKCHHGHCADRHIVDVYRYARSLGQVAA